MIKAVLFDLDDTLLTFRTDQARRAYREGAQRTYAWLKEHHLPVPSFRIFYARDRFAAWKNDLLSRLTGRQLAVRHVFRKLCLELRLQRDEVSISRLSWLWYEPTAQTATVPAEVIPTLTALRDAGIKLGVIHNTSQQGEIIDHHLQLQGLLEFFPTRIYSSDVSYRKPDRRIFEFALNELGIRAPEAIYVGDSTKTDVTGARRAGMIPVLLQRRLNGVVTKGQSDHTINSLSELLRIPALRECFQQPPAPARHNGTPQRHPHLARN